MVSKPKVLAAAYLTVDGALFIKRLMGIDMLPPALALIGNVYYPQDQAVVDDHTVPVLVEQGLIDAYGNVDPALESWMRVLENPDVDVSLRAMRSHTMRRAVVARRGQHHVLALRRNDAVVIQGLWSQGAGFDDVVSAPLWAALRVSEDTPAPGAAEFEPVTLPLDQVTMLANAAPGEMVRELRRTLGVNVNTAKILNEMSKYSGQRAEIVVRQNRGMDTVQTPVGVGVADTIHGRVISAVRQERSDVWVTFGPGNYARFRAAMADLVRLTPAKNWFNAVPGN
jgi:hypothetical protein